MKERKHAYLIIAHCNFGQVKKLIQLIDDSRNDIYIHIDNKVKGYESICNELQKATKYSKILFCERTRVTWGGYSLVKAELLLLMSVGDLDSYRYYHLISGMDLPLKSQDEIHHFFDTNDGYEFLELWDKNKLNDRINRIKYYWPLQEKRGMWDRKSIYVILSRLIFKLQKMMSINRLSVLGDDYRLAVGSNWFSITNDLAKYIVENQETINRVFKYTLCCDEFFVQTLVSNSCFRGRIYDVCVSNNNTGNNMRKIDWERGQPYIWRVEDYQELVCSNELFARKFDERIDSEIIDKIFAHLCSNNIRQ